MAYLADKLKVESKINNATDQSGNLAGSPQAALLVILGILQDIIELIPEDSDPREE